jgi:hypothetical protein
MSSDAPHTSRNLPGAVAFWLAIFYVAIQVAVSGASVAIPAMASFRGANLLGIGVIFTMIGISQLLLAVSVTILGAVGVTRKAAPRVLAAVALGVGGSGAVGGLASLVLPPLVGVALNA